MVHWPCQVWTVGEDWPNNVRRSVKSSFTLVRGSPFFIREKSTSWKASTTKGLTKQHCTQVLVCVNTLSSSACNYTIGTWLQVVQCRIGGTRKGEWSFQRHNPLNVIALLWFWTLSWLGSLRFTDWTDRAFFSTCAGTHSSTTVTLSSIPIPAVVSNSWIREATDLYSMITVVDGE